MAAHFDNIDDVNSKFAGTICYHDKKPVIIKQANHDPEAPGEFLLLVQGMVGRGKTIKLTDPLLNYKNFNIGYANTGSYASWWYRKPNRQYRQGLKKDQMYWRISNANAMIEEGFNFSKPFTNMLEDSYPNLDVCQEQLMLHERVVVAFHKDFALSWDEIHDDYILEYRGKKIGASVGKNLLKYRLLDEAKHLNEALQEALPNVYG